MQPRLIPWNRLLGLFLHILVCQAAWVQQFQCGGSSEPNNNALLGGPFWIDSLRGTLDDTADGSQALSLSILAVYNVSQFACSDVDLAELETDLRFHVLGRAVGHVERFRSTCPLPITDALTPFEGFRFSKYELVYAFSRAHLLQTLAAEFSFKDRDGIEIDCAAAKVTPDIGTAASAAFTYFPAGVMVVVGIASWLRRLGKNSLLETKTSAIWDVILDIANYVRYLQFLFLAGSLSVEYPGFYQPIVSKVAWAALLYWRGPIDHGFTYTGVEDGMYVSNASYGLEYMAQMLGFPQMPDIMLNAFINIVILVSGLLVVLLILCLIALGQSRVPLSSASVLKAGCLASGAILSFFSLPLLSYMSYDLVLIGYLPDYRVTLVALTMAVLVCSNYLIVRRLGSQKEELDTSSAEASVSTQDSGRSRSRSRTGIREAVKYISHYLPHGIPLLQGIMIGGLQDWGLVQLLVLGGCEVIILLDTAMQRRVRAFESKFVWCAAVRLLTVSLSIAFARPSSETAKQWIGYLILCLHAATVVFGFLLVSLWQLYTAARKRIVSSELADDSMPPLTLDDLPPRLRISFAASQRGSYTDNQRKASPNVGSSRGSDSDSAVPPFFSSTGPSGKHHIPYLPSFYRTPRRASPNSSLEVCRPGSSRGNDSDNAITPFSSSTPSGKHYVTDFSAFYRDPRRKNRTRLNISSDVGSSASRKSAPSEEDEEEEEEEEEEEARRSDSYTLDELLEVPRRLSVDFSVRESDLYYNFQGRPRPVAPSSSEKVEEIQSSRLSLLERTRRIAARLKPEKEKEKEKGFQVMRPPRPT